MVNKVLKKVSYTLIGVLLLSAFFVPYAFASNEEDSSDRTVSVSAENTTAFVEGYDFALDDFYRAQVGSNRAFDGVYYGYSYYEEETPSSFVAIASNDYVVVYTAGQALEAGYDANILDHQEALKACLIELDKQNANGGALVGGKQTWYFTQDEHFVVGEVAFNFNQELRPGQFFSSVIGIDGSDVTASDNPAYLRLTHADFATITTQENAAMVASKTGLGAFSEFLSTIDYSPLWVTLKTTSVAIVFIFVLGLAAAYFSLRIPKRAQDIADSIFTIPMVLPPTVCGFILLLLLGKNSPIGQWFIDIGFPLIFSWPATVIAAVVVAFPLMYRSARGAFEGLDQNMLDAARTLGWSNGKVFFKLMLPLAWSSIAAGAVLALARALGEFGATLFLAGNYLGVTRTIPIAIYFEWMNGNTDVAIFWTVIIIIFCFIVILAINLFSRRTTKYRRVVQK